MAASCMSTAAVACPWLASQPARATRPAGRASSQLDNQASCPGTAAASPCSRCNQVRSSRASAWKRPAGAPWQVARWADASVVNAGDGWHEHPTQALLDCYTIRQHLGGVDGRHIAIIGDIKHSRVARSDVLAFTAMGAEVTLVAPPTLLPPSLEGWPVKVSHDLDQVLPTVDVAYLLA